VCDCITRIEIYIHPVSPPGPHGDGRLSAAGVIMVPGKLKQPKIIMPAPGLLHRL